MGRDLHFVPNSFYRVDDRTGFPTRAERTRKEWNGLQVNQRVWEPRQPQDLVRGVPDYQAVPDPRPLAPNSFVGPTEVSISTFAGPGATALSVDSYQGLVWGDAVGLMLDDGVLFRTTLLGFNGAGQVVLADKLPSGASAGNLLIDLHIPGAAPPSAIGTFVIGRSAIGGHL